MVKIGRNNQLRIIKKVDFGVYLDGEDLGNILLPKRYLPKQYALDELIDVFLYFDSDDLLIATTETPKAMVNECACLTVAAVNRVGAFLDWGLAKELLVPFGEQEKPLIEGNRYVVFVYIDDSGRIVASTKLSDHLGEQSDYFKAGQAVDLLISGRTDLGYKAVINHHHLGLIFQNEIFQPLKIGQRVKGYIKTIRDDQKIDLSLQPSSDIQSRQSVDEKIIQYLKEHDGTTTLTDKSPPELIYSELGISKGAFKRAVGSLYKQRKITIKNKLINLVDQ